MDIRQPNPTQAAGILRAFLKESGVDIKHCAALEAVARMGGYSDWQAMAADRKRRESAEAAGSLLRREPTGEYVYVGPHGQGTWLVVNNISVYVKADDEGVVADLFAHRGEDPGSLASTWVTYQEALDTLCEKEQVDEDEVSAWAETTRSVPDWRKLPWARKSELVREFAGLDAAARREFAPLAQGSDEGELRYVHGEWDHIFSSGQREARFVFDRVEHAVVAMQLRRARSKLWEAASREAYADLQDSLLNANDAALEQPGDYDLEESATLPQWARELGLS